MPSRPPPGETRGWIVPIGGAENKENDPAILERFVAVSGGRSADIVVIPTASRMHETGPRYERIFKSLGAGCVAVMDFDTRRDCQEAGRLRRLEEATGIFFSPAATNCGSPHCSAAHRWPRSSACAMRMASRWAARVRAPAFSAST